MTDANDPPSKATARSRRSAKDSSESTPSVLLPDDFQERVFKAIAVQRPAAAAYIKEIRRKNPDATPARVMKTIEAQYVASTTLASTAIGATATIPGVGIPVALGLGVADLLFFYETTALFALTMTELRGIPIDDPERAKAVVLGALLGEKRRSKVTELILSVLPAGSTITGARAAAGTTLGSATPKWGDLLAQQLPDSALVPVTMVLARRAIAQGAVMGTVKISSKAIPVVGAVAGGATSFYFGSGVVKSVRDGFSAPVESWPEWLELTDADGDGVPDPSRAVLALRAASDSAKDFGESVWERVVDATDAFRSVDIDGDGIPDEARALTAVRGAATAAGGLAKSVGARTAGAAGAVVKIFKRDDDEDESETGT
jgi:hypothetical protein